MPALGLNSTQRSCIAITLVLASIDAVVDIVYALLNEHAHFHQVLARCI